MLADITIDLSKERVKPLGSFVSTHVTGHHTGSSDKVAGEDEKKHVKTVN